VSKDSISSRSKALIYTADVSIVKEYTYDFIEDAKFIITMWVDQLYAHNYNYE
jgi:hypothetical protein